MSIRFDITKNTIPKGKILIRRFNTDDWWLSAELEERYEDRGSVNDPVNEVEDWGVLSSATSNLRSS